MWNPPRPGIELVSPVLAGGFLSTGSPGKSPKFLFIVEPFQYSRLFWDLCVPFIKLNCGMVEPSSNLLSSLPRKILCASVGGGLLSSGRMKASRQRQIWVILGSRRWPRPKQVASNSFCCLEGSVPGMTQSDQAGPCHKAGRTAAAGESHTWPPATGGRQETVPGNSALWGGEPNYEGWMWDGVIKGFLERESN